MSKLIYVADDEKRIRDIVNIFLTNAGFAVKTFKDGNEIWQALQTTTPDLLIIDVMMPHMNGLELCKKIREISQVPIIIISAKSEEVDRITGLLSGSDDYLCKPFSSMELVIRVQKLLARTEAKNSPITIEQNDNSITFHDMTISFDKREIFINHQPLSLTNTQFELLLYMSQNANKAISREELIEKVWQSEVQVGVRITDDMIKRVRKKLKDANSCVRIESVWGYGFKLTAK